MTRLHVALVQKASGLDPRENRALLDVSETLVTSRPEGGDRPVDLVVYPEAFARDFGEAGSDIAPFAEPADHEGPFVSAAAEFAKDHGLTVVAGMFERSDDPDRPFNTLVVVDPTGLRATYRKIHLYDSFGFQESERLMAGELEPVVVDIEGFRVGLMTCYDLRFPELARMLVDRGADVLVVPSAWVAGPAKVDHWRTLVKARAIENTVYVVAVGQPAPRYTGHSMVVSPLGEVLAEAGEGDEVVTAVLESAVVDEARAKNPSLANRRL